MGGWRSGFVVRALFAVLSMTDLWVRTRFLRWLLGMTGLRCPQNDKLVLQGDGF